MQIATYQADDRLLLQVQAAAARQATLADRLAFSGMTATSIARQLRRDFIYEGAHIQGNPLTREAVDAILTRPAAPGKILPEHREVMNLHLGLNYIETLAGGEMPLTERLVRILHAVLMSGLAGGGEDEVGSYRANDLRDFGYPVPAASEVIAEMGAFGRWMTLKPGMPDYEPQPILRAAYAHTRLLTIHPFFNGNGRVARLLLNLLLLRAGYPIIAIDGSQRPAYLAALEAASRHQDLTDILTLVLAAAGRSLAAYENPAG